MKKTFFISLFFLITGLVIGNHLYHKVDVTLLPTFTENNSFYILQQGVYHNKELMEEETKNIRPKIVFLKDNKYYVYVGVTAKLENAEKIKKILEDDGYDVFIKDIKIKDEEFVSNMQQFDILIKNATNPDEIITIEEVVLSSYEKKLENSSF